MVIRAITAGRSGPFDAILIGLDDILNILESASCFRNFSAYSSVPLLVVLETRVETRDSMSNSGGLERELRMLPWDRVSHSKHPVGQG